MKIKYKMKMKYKLFLLLLVMVPHPLQAAVQESPPIKLKNFRYEGGQTKLQQINIFSLI